MAGLVALFSWQSLESFWFLCYYNSVNEGLVSPSGTTVTMFCSLCYRNGWGLFFFPPCGMAMITFLFTMLPWQSSGGAILSWWYCGKGYKEGGPGLIHDTF